MLLKHRRVREKSQSALLGSDATSQHAPGSDLTCCYRAQRCPSATFPRSLQPPLGAAHAASVPRAAFHRESERESERERAREREAASTRHLVAISSSFSPESTASTPADHPTRSRSQQTDIAARLRAQAGRAQHKAYQPLGALSGGGDREHEHRELGAQRRLERWLVRGVQEVDGE
eukprot:210939-Rhodomonas_salina.1